MSGAIEREMWEKWILLAGLGGINCLMRGTIGEVAQTPRGPEFVAGLLQEIVAVVGAVGVAPDPEFAVAAKANVDRKRARLRPHPCIETCKEACASRRIKLSAILKNALAHTASRRLCSAPFTPIFACISAGY